MEKRKEIIAAFLASSANTLEQLMEEGQANELTMKDAPGVMDDVFTLARIYLALHHNDLSILDKGSLAFMDEIEAFAFKNGGIEPISKITS
jgi:hypothetical protein